MPLDSARLTHLHDVLVGHVERGVAPGVVSLISQGGEVYADAIGVTAVGGGTPMRRDTIFRISSMTKPITAVATLVLVEECKLRLDDAVDELLPELAGRRVLTRIDAALDDTVPARRSITVRDLLTFRMGLGMLIGGPYPIQQAMDEVGLGVGPPDPAGPPAPDEWMRRLGTLPLAYQPGEQWLYHMGAEVLGVLIARATGQPFEQFLRERIFEPLGMVDTGFSVPTEKIERMATAYFTDPTNGGLIPFDPPDGRWSRPPAFPSGGGGLVSTADDYLAFCRMLLGKGRYGSERILTALSVDAMTTDHLEPAHKDGADIFFGSHGWGFGIGIVTRLVDPSEPVGMFGWDGGLGTTAQSDPANDMVTILMTQAAWTSPAPPAICRDFRTAAYAAVS